MRKELCTTFTYSLVIACLLSACTSTSTIEDHIVVSSAESLRYQDIQWGALNPARGDNSPRAGNLWGDRTGSGASGFLVQFVDGFSSPPHIHNITYRGVVINGLVHNDDPNAENMWLPSGSFWTQPAGDVHITSAQGQFNLAYIEIDEGPYLVQPTKDAFQADDISINVDESNLVWLDASSMTWIDADRSGNTQHGARISLLWGDPQSGEPYGSMIKFPAGFDGEIRSNADLFCAIVIQGEVETADASLGAGSYFGSDSPTAHVVHAAGKDETLVYVRTNAPYRVVLD